MSRVFVAVGATSRGWRPANRFRDFCRRAVRRVLGAVLRGSGIRAGSGRPNVAAPPLRLDARRQAVAASTAILHGQPVTDCRGERALHGSRAAGQSSSPDAMPGRTQRQSPDRMISARGVPEFSNAWRTSRRHASVASSRGEPAPTSPTRRWNSPRATDASSAIDRLRSCFGGSRAFGPKRIDIDSKRSKR